MWAAGNLQNNLKGTFRFIKDEAHRSESECLLKTVEVQKSHAGQADFSE